MWKIFVGPISFGIFLHFFVNYSLFYFVFSSQNYFEIPVYHEFFYCIYLNCFHFSHLNWNKTMHFYWDIQQSFFLVLYEKRTFSADVFSLQESYYGCTLRYFKIALIERRLRCGGVTKNIRNFNVIDIFYFFPSLSVYVRKESFVTIKYVTSTA